MTVNIIEAIDPNATNASNKQLAVVTLAVGKISRAVQPGELGAIMRQLDIDTLEVEDQLTRVVIKDQQSYGLAGALAKEVSGLMKSADTLRMNIGKPLRDMTTELNKLFKIYTDRLDIVKEDLNAKSVVYGRVLAEEARIKATAERKRIEDEALALAAAAIGIAGAEEIMQAGVEVAAQVSAKVELVEAYGVKTGLVKVKSGLVVDAVAFLKFLTVNPSVISEVIDFKKSGLNRLAKDFESAALLVNGVYAGVKLVETDSSRNY